MKEIEKDTNKRHPVFMYLKTQYCKIDMQPKVMYKINEMHIKILMIFFTGIENTISKFI